MHPFFNAPSQPLKVMMWMNHVSLCDSILEILKKNRVVPLVAKTSQAAYKIWESESPDIMLMYLSTSRNEIFDLIERIRFLDWDPSNRKTAILLVSDTEQSEDLDMCLLAGADDFLIIPFSERQLLKKIRFTGVRSIKSLLPVSSTLFMELLDIFDPAMKEHSMNVALVAYEIALDLADKGKFANVTKGDFVENIFYASLYHDIGKFGIHPIVRDKVGKYSTEEKNEMNRHPIIGNQYFSQVLENHPDEPIWSMAQNVAMYHHERFDGLGYPYNLKGYDIPLEARIVAVANAYDNMTTQKPYRGKRTHHTAVKIIKSEASISFDPDVVEAFINKESLFVYSNHKMNTSPPNNELE
jgi:putative two-component system response regulator